MAFFTVRPISPSPIPTTEPAHSRRKESVVPETFRALPPTSKHYPRRRMPGASARPAIASTATTSTERLDEDIMEHGNLAMQPATWEMFLAEHTLGRFFDDAQAMENGESNAKLRWKSSLNPVREPGRARKGKPVKTKPTSLNPGSDVFMFEHEHVSARQVLTNPVSSSISSLPRTSFPRIARPLTPVLTEQNSTNGPFPMSLSSPSKSRGLGITYYPSSNATIPAPAPEYFNQVPSDGQELGTTNITFFEQYETLSHFLSLASSNDPIDRSAADSPCSSLSFRTSYSSSDCKRDAHCCSEVDVTYQLGPCLCDKCHPNNSTSDSTSGSNDFSPRRRNRKPTRLDGKETDLPAKTRWNSWWSSISASFSRPASLAKSEVKHPSSLLSSPILPEVQKAMLSPDSCNSGVHVPGCWEAEVEQGEEERVRMLTRHPMKAAERVIRERWERDLPLPELP